MNSNYRQLVLIVVLNLIMVIALIIGVKQTISIVNFFSTLTISSLNELFESFQSHFINFMRLDIKLIAGILFCAFVVFYDLYLTFRWFTSFNFTAKKTCKSCSQRLIREQRLLGDRIISFILPVKRFRCVGCGAQYLKVERHSKESEVFIGETKSVKAKS